MPVKNINLKTAHFPLIESHAGQNLLPKLTSNSMCLNQHTTGAMQSSLTSFFEESRLEGKSHCFKKWVNNKMAHSVTTLKMSLHYISKCYTNWLQMMLEHGSPIFRTFYAVTCNHGGNYLVDY